MMGERIRAFDWTGTAVGPLAGWPLSLRVAVELCLNSRFPMFVWWGKDLINIYNDAYAPMMGTRHPAGLGVSAKEIWREIWSDIGPQTDAVLLRAESTWNERRQLTLERNGYPEECYFTWSYSPIFDQSGQVHGLFCAVTEETERVKLEGERTRLSAAIERERANLASIIEQSPSFIAVLRGPEHVYELANEKYYEIAGRRNLVGRTVRQAFPDIAEQGFYELLDQVYRTGETFSANELPLFLTRSDGTVHKLYINLVYQALRDDRQQPSGIFVHGVDITDMVLSRQAMKENEEFHRFANEAGKTGSWKADLATMEAVFSPAMCQLLGLPAVKTTLAFEDWFSFVVPEHRPAMQSAIESAIRDDVPYDFEFQVTRTDGTRCWLASRGGAIRDSVGKAVGLHGATVDITDKRKMAEERERLLESERAARAEAEHASRPKDKFLAVLSHELRTPLSPVVMTIPAIESDPQLPQRFRDDLAMVRRNIELEVKLIDDLLDLSRITTGKLRLQMQPVRVHELLLHMIQSSQSDVVAKQLQLTTRLKADNDQLMGDPARLQQVFWNLLRNAIKFTPDGGRITVSTSNIADAGNSKRLVVEIADTGVGIAPEILPRVFDAFEQGDARTTRQFGGLGLGLAISKAVVEMHGGSISASSAGHRQGALFVVKLDVQTKVDSAPRPAPSVKSNLPSDNTVPRVLLVEDHADTSRTMARLLKNAGFTVAIAQSVTSALSMLDNESFDVIVSDIGLPDASGYDLMRQARNRHNVTGIALSGYGMEDDIRKSREAGFSEHLVKPVDIPQLLEVLRRITGKQ
jgi:PAS domain S-box-containing protein